MRVLIQNVKVVELAKDSLSFGDVNCLEIVDGVIHAVESKSSNVEVNMDRFDTIVDGNGSLLLPGFQDAHIHVSMLGESQHYVNLSQCDSIASLQNAVQMKIEDEPDLPFYVGFCWDHSVLGRLPTRADLDALTAKPIFLWRACWHIGVANTAALKLASMFTPRPSSDLVLDPATDQLTWRMDGGAMDFESDSGYPTGILRERAVETIINAFASHKTPEVQRQFLLEGLQLCLQKGLTAVHSNDERCLELYRELQAEQLLPMRVLLTPTHAELVNPALKQPAPLFNIVADAVGNASEMSSRLGVDRVKIFSDGSLGAQTAAMKVYTDNSEQQGNHQGILMHSTAALETMLEEAADRALRVEIHAIGDAAAEQVTSAIASVNRRHHKDGSARRLVRPLLTHCQILDADTVRRMHEEDIVANVQPSFVPTDMRWVQRQLSHPVQRQYAYAWKTLLEAGVAVAGGSDAPIEDASPFMGIYDAVRRTNLHRLRGDRSGEEVFRAGECLSLLAAIRLYTSGAAYAAMYERVWGQIAVGQVADCVLVDPALLRPECVEQWHDARPRLSIVGGHVSYISEDERASGGVRLVREAAQSRDWRDRFHAATAFLRRDDSSTTGGAAVQSDAVYMAGRGGRGMWTGHAGRTGYCRCLLHMEYCGTL